MLQLDGGCACKGLGKSAFPSEFECVRLLRSSGVNFFRQKVHQGQQQLTRLVRQSLDSRENKFRIHTVNLPPSVAASITICHQAFVKGGQIAFVSADFFRISALGFILPPAIL